MPIAARVKREAGIVTRAVGLIVTPAQAEDVVAKGEADQVALGRGFLDDPHWGWHAAKALGADVPRPRAICALGTEAVGAGGEGVS